MDIVKSSEKVQHVIEEKFKGFGRGKYGRILKMARKPTHEEFMKVIWITGLGLMLVGAVGFLIYLVMIELPKILF